MAINRASISKELLPGLNAVFGMEYGEVDNEHQVLFEDVQNISNFVETFLTICTHSVIFPVQIHN